MESLQGVCDVTVVRGARGGDPARLLFEVAHGATRAADYDRLLSELRGTFPADLRDFFFVNTDVGAPEVAQRAAELAVAAQPELTALVIRCRIPRTFIDCNRLIDVSTPAQGSAAGEMTPGLHAWVRDPADRALLFERYSAYRARVERACDEICGRGGQAVMVHSYAPRSVDVAVDENIVASLRAAYAPERLSSWPLRAPVDLIVDTEEGERLADPEVVARAEAGFSAAGFAVERNGAYSLHPATLAHLIAKRHRGRTLCLELRRDLLVDEFTPFQEMFAKPDKVERLAAPLAAALWA
jgi:predicted N-formylglutamate amidohydrolase